MIRSPLQQLVQLLLHPAEPVCLLFQPAPGLLEPLPQLYDQRPGQGQEGGGQQKADHFLPDPGGQQPAEKEQKSAANSQQEPQDKKVGEHRFPSLFFMERRPLTGGRRSFTRCPAGAACPG